MRTLIIWAVIIGAAVLFLRWRDKGRNSQPAGQIHGTGKYEFEIVGESNYQAALKAIAGPKQEDGVEHFCVAELILEDSNPHDSKAVRVDIDGRTVGYLSRDLARQYRKQISVGTMTAPAVIVGGWNRGGDDSGHYGVKLDLPLE